MGDFAYTNMGWLMNICLTVLIIPNMTDYYNLTNFPGLLLRTYNNVFIAASISI